MRILLLLMLLPGCARLPPQPWTRVGPSRVAEILVRRQCAGCHSVESVFGAASEEAPPERTCTRAREVSEGTGFCHVPTLASMERFRARWLRSFLEKPIDVRPELAETMIPHALSPAEVDALIIGWRAEEEGPASPLHASLARGEALFQQKQCGACHHFGARGLVPGPVAATERQRALAPDLQHSRRRLSRATLERFILSPSSVKPTTEMPRTPVTPDEARALADFIAFAP